MERDLNTEEIEVIKKYTTKGVLVKSSERKVIAKPLVRLIISLQKDLQDKENKKRTVGKRKKITFLYASLILERTIKR